MRRAGANRIRAVFDKELDDREVAALGGKMNRERVIAVVADVGVGAAFEQRLHDGFVPRAEVQRGPPACMPRQHATLVDEIKLIQDCD